MTRVRTPLMAYPLVRLVVGLSVGFAGAVAVVWAIDLLGDEAGVVAFETTAGAPDFTAYCAAQGLEARAIGDMAPTWVCVGVRDGSWSSTPIDVRAVCAEQYQGARASGSPSAGWRCVAPLTQD